MAVARIPTMPSATEPLRAEPPEPIELPTTSATHIQKLRSCGLAGVMGQHYNVRKVAQSARHLTLTPGI
jgi:hypothetical protein